jgi:septal ring factor EnvC (AmiA/AmiB activator)
MRYLILMATAAGCLLGCATPGVPAALLEAQRRESEQWQRQYEEEHARTEALAQRLAAVESALELVRLERAEAEQAHQALKEELRQNEAERLALEEHNEKLRQRERQLAEAHEELSDVWFEAALSRARRHSNSTEPESPSTARTASP